MKKEMNMRSAVKQGSSTKGFFTIKRVFTIQAVTTILLLAALFVILAAMRKQKSELMLVQMQKEQSILLADEIWDVSKSLPKIAGLSPLRAEKTSTTMSILI